MRGSSERKISSSSTGLGHLRVGQRAVLGQQAVLLVAGRQLDVRLAEQRLRAQDRARVSRDRRVALVELDRRVGRLAGAELELDDLADGHAGDAHVRLLGELRRLAEADVEAVALRLEREAAAERDPQVQQQAEAGEREARHDEDASECGCLLLHRSVPGRQVGCSSSGAGSRAASRAKRATHLRRQDGVDVPVDAR